MLDIGLHEEAGEMFEEAEGGSTIARIHHKAVKKLPDFRILCSRSR
jgi:hypothetical protein